MRAVHEVKVAAPAREVYQLLADLDNWPWIFAPFVHTELLGTDGGSERVGMWTTSGEGVEHWVALRRLDEDALRICFRPERPVPPLASMERSWVVEPLSATECTARLLHTYELGDDGPQTRADTARVIDTIAEGETEAVRAAAELVTATPELRVEVVDTIDFDASPEAVYDVLFDVGAWTGALPHVTGTRLLQDGGDHHLVEVDTAESRGGTMTMRTARVGRPHQIIAYKQLVLPPIGSSHHVRWRLTPAAAGVTVTSAQTAVIRPDGIARLLGEGADVAEARTFVQRELSAKVRLTLEGAKEHLGAG
ncbi:SRPBCC family protein [Streptomyces sp. NPDC047097]|uniref:aromatase/cyclase n=1 Tax=Streptomyces sp. NPDC047097 TaxID=3155260 RepID=UPI0033C38D53